MFDATTNNLVAPVKVVRNCLGGAYITYSYNKSAKFRINMGTGEQCRFKRDIFLVDRDHLLFANHQQHLVDRLLFIGN